MEARTERVAVVTGAGNGIGAATAELLAGQGWIVYLVDIDQAGLDRVVARLAGLALAGEAQAVPMDVGDEQAWLQLRQRIAQEHARIQGLVNNAYQLVKVPAADMTLESWEMQVRINLTSVYFSVRAFVDQMASGGSIVNVSSVHAHVGVPGHSAYAATKGAIIALSRQLAVEYGPRIRVNAVVPGPIRTAAWQGLSEADLERAATATALGRVGDPMDVAHAIGFLLSDAAGFVTGSTLTVDGGWLAKKDSQ